MSMMRLCVLVAGCTNAAGTNSLFENTTAPCAQQTQCTSAYATCISASTGENCTHAQGCIAARMACLFAAPDSSAPVRD